MRHLTRVLLGFVLLDAPLAGIFFLLPYPNSSKLLLVFAETSLYALLIGGLAGLFYGNVSPKDQDWRLSKTLVALYRISSWISGKREDDVTTLSLGKKDKPED